MNGGNDAWRLCETRVILPAILTLAPPLPNNYAGVDSRASFVIASMPKIRFWPCAGYPNLTHSERVDKKGDHS